MASPPSAGASTRRVGKTSAVLSPIRGGNWRHELVREEHSCQTHGFHREGEPSCGEAASAGYGLDASKAETRTKEPLCGALAGPVSFLSPRGQAGALCPFRPSSPGNVVMNPSLPSRKLRAASGSQVFSPGLLCPLQLGENPGAGTWAPRSRPALPPNDSATGAAFASAARKTGPTTRGDLGCCPCEKP